MTDYAVWYPNQKVAYRHIPRKIKSKSFIIGYLQNLSGDFYTLYLKNLVEKFNFKSIRMSESKALCLCCDRSFLFSLLFKSKDRRELLLILFCFN